MPVYSVKDLDGQYVACRDECSIPLRTRDGHSLPLLPGWTPTKVIAGHSPIQVLELLREDGQRAVWFLDAEFAFITNNILSLSDRDQLSLLEDVERARKTIWQQLVCRATQAIDEDTRS